MGIRDRNQTAQVTGTYTAEDGGGDSGGCPLFTKAMQPFVDVLVYEPVLPATAGKAGLRECGPLTPLAIRLRSDDGIVEDSVWGTVTWGDAASEDVTWQALDTGQTDGWVVYEPATAWPAGEVVTFTAGACTTTGYAIGPFTYELLVNDGVYDGAAGVVETGGAPAPPAGFGGTAVEIDPGMVYLEPVTV